MTRISLLTVLSVLTVAGGLCASSFGAGAELFVSPSGDDANPGTKEKPFATLEAARDAARSRRKSGPVTVRLGGGDYFRTKTFSLAQEDSGRVSFVASPGAKVRLIGARIVKPRDFARVTDKATLARISPEARKHVVRLDLAALGVRNCLRWADLIRNSPGTIELFFGGKRMGLARWPNGRPATMKRVLDNNGSGKVGGTFEYRDDRHANWPVDRGVWVRGYWRVPWQIEIVRIAAIDARRRTVTLAARVAGGIGSKYARPHGSGTEPYWAVNLLEELDRPGEWCIDFETKRLYFWPPAAVEKNEILISDMPEPLISLKGASHVVLRGMTLEGGLGDAITITGGAENLIDAMEIRNFGAWGVLVRGGKRHGVNACSIHDMGGGGIELSGGDRKTLTPAGHFATNNHIHHYGQVQKVYAAAVKTVNAVGNRVAHNLIHDAPHVGVLLGGNDNVLEYNEISRVCLVSNDMGGFYSYHDWTSRGNVLRYNFVHSSPNAHGIYFDDGDSGDIVYGNVLYRLDAGVFVGGGHDNIVTGNLAIECRKGVHIDARGVSRGYNLTHRRLVGAVKRVNHKQPPWSEKYPAMVRILEFHPDLPTGNVFRGNTWVRCERDFNRSGRKEHLRFTTFGKNAERNDILKIQNAEQLRSALRKPPFKHVPIDKIGPRKDKSIQ